jgi:hypothetical protein
MMMNATATASVFALITAILGGRRANSGCSRSASAGAPHRPRHAAAFGKQLIDSGLADRDQRKLGGHEKTVGQDQRQNREQAESDVNQTAIHTSTSGLILQVLGYALRLEKKCASTNSSMAA